MPFQSTVTTVVLTGIGKSGCSIMVSRHEATTATNKLQAANADDDTIQLADFFGDVKTTIVTSMVADIPPKNALTNDSCSATATT